MESPFSNPISADDAQLRIEALRQAVAVAGCVDNTIVESAEAFYDFLTSAAGEDK